MFYIYWKRFPFVRMLPAFLIGIYISQFLTPVNIILPIALSLIVTISIYLLKFKPLKQSYLLHILLFTIGLTVSASTKTEQHFAESNKINAIATILESLEVKEKTYKTIAKLEYKDKKESYNVTKSILYIKKSEAAQKLTIGDKIQIEAQLSTIPKPSLPGQFDYNAFMANKGIYYTTYIPSDKWAVIESSNRYIQVKQLAEKGRLHFASVIDQHISQEASGLIKAITLGLKADLDKATKTSFSKAGIMHILAVSGLHVGIVWSLLALLLKPVVHFQPKLKIVVIILEILLVWVFAFITGFSPSVQRAAFMFSLFSLSKINKLEKDSLNILAASAIILLLINAKLLFSVGFQLSYSAMVSIIILYPKIYKTLHFKHKILDYFWQIQAVSIAAVIGTAPITIYYFHQFSLIFPITNLLAIPIAYLLVSGTLLLLMVSQWTFLAHILGVLISWLAANFITSITLISRFKFASIDHLYINYTEMILIALLIASITITLYNFRIAKKAIITSLILLNLIFLYRGGRKVLEYSKQESYEFTEFDYYTYCINVGNKVFTFQNTEHTNSFAPTLSGYYKASLLYKHENFKSVFDELKDETSTIDIHYAHDVR